MKTIVVGLPLFAKELAENLSQFDKKNKYLSYNTYYSRLDKIKYFISVLTADVVVSLKGVAENSLALKWAMFLKKPILMGWMGSDVQGAQTLSENRKMNHKLLNYATHFTDAIWLQQELLELEVKASILHFKSITPSQSGTPKHLLGVSAYIGQGREEFYGINSFLALARQYPRVSFHAYGTKGTGFEAPKNCKFHGWIKKEEVQKILNEFAIVYRNTNHDGNSQSVIEALANGNIVMWNYPMDGCIKIDKSVEDAFEEAVKLVESGTNRSRLVNKYIEFYNPESIYRKFTIKLREIGKK